MKNYNPRLQIIHNWYRDRLKNNVDADGTASFLTKFVESGLKELTDKLHNGQLEDLIVTVRSSFRNDNTFLRPVYSQPEQLRNYFQDRGKQKPFTFPDKAIALDGINFYDNSKTGRKPYSFAAFYPISDKSCPADSFRSRINDFHQGLLTSKELGTLASKATCCFFAGRNKEEKRAPQIELKHILAVYFPQNTDNCLSKDPAELLSGADDLFDGLDLISLIDASLFEAEGLKLVAKLLPEFSRDDIAPADQIAFALERLRALLNRHMIGRHGGDKAPQLFYMATSFERQDEKTIYPRLEIYPHVYRREHLGASYFVTHRDIPSATKFLLMRYLKSEEQLLVETTPESLETARGKLETPVKCAPKFEQLFDADKLGTLPLRDWQDAITPPAFPDFLYLTSGDAIEVSQNPDKRTPWEALNKPLDPDLRSVAAFVVEGRIVDTIQRFDRGILRNIPKRCLPRGLFAIESHYEDGFSDADIQSLRFVFQGLAALIRLVSHQNAPIDYRSLIAKTFKQDAELLDRNNPKVSRLIFLVQKLDAELFRELLEKVKTCEDPLRTYGVEKRSIKVLQQIELICPGNTDAQTPEQRAHILEDRLRELQVLLSGDSKHSDINKEDMLENNVLSFLEACPENFTWSSYLACMAQTLGDRIAGTKLPRFRRMLPGFSASGMFMAMVDSELRQVVKLSNSTKLRQEINRYRKWVRYRLVNAARIPTNGLAFETTGDNGKTCGLGKSETITPIPADKDTCSDGVLVSDLVSGGQEAEEVDTLLDLIATNIGRKGAEGEENARKFNQALDAVFIRNAILWQTVPRDEKVEEEPVTAALIAFRIPATEADDPDLRRTFEDDIDRLRLLRRGMKIKPGFNGLLQLFKSAAPYELDSLQHEHYRICHGDLNARNLTWAEALQSFFLIDFERVGPNVVGTDQFRLLVNLLIELRSGWDSASNMVAKEQESGLPTIYKEIDCGLCYIGNIFARLIKSGRVPQTLEEIATHERDKDTFHESKIVKTLATILNTVAPDSLNSPEWRWYWSLMILCSAAREFGYSCRSVTQQQINDILNDRKIDDIKDLYEFETLVEAYVADKPGLKNWTSIFIRHFITAKLLLKFVDCMKR